jgi:manganese/zinc/iron transport system permease protein
MSNAGWIVVIAALAGASGALAGLFLVLRRRAMLADAMSHSILPGLVAAYAFANGPNLAAGMAGAVAAAWLTAAAVEWLTRSGRVTPDGAIGLVFPTLFAVGVVAVTRFFSNAHLDTDAVLYGEIAFAPFDRWEWAGRDLGPAAFWILLGLLAVNALVVAGLRSPLTVTAFDPEFARTQGLHPERVNAVLVTLVAVTTVGAFGAVGAVLTVALLITPTATALLMARRLPGVALGAVFIGVLAGVLGSAAAFALDVSISGMIATVLGVMFGLGVLVRAQARG